MKWYIQLNNGNCGIVNADDMAEAFREAKKGLNKTDRDNGIEVRSVRPATKENIDHVKSMGGIV